MVNHPGRVRASHGVHPSPGEIAQAQSDAGHTNADAAACISVADKTWEDYKAGRRKMPPGLWEYYCLQCEYPREMSKLIRQWRSGNS